LLFDEWFCMFFFRLVRTALQTPIMASRGLKKT
jgi:hypothetical protein